MSSREAFSRTCSSVSNVTVAPRTLLSIGTICFLNRPSAMACAARRCPSTARASQAIAERSEEHTSELQSLMRISYAVFCLKKNNTHHPLPTHHHHHQPPTTHTPHHPHPHTP